MTLQYYNQQQSKTCGLACLRMIFSNFSDYISEKELVKQVKVHSFGIFSTDLAIIALKKGYKTTLYTFNLPLFSKYNIEFGTLVNLKLIRKISPKPSSKKAYDSIKNYLKYGGVLYYDYPRLELLEKYLDQEWPCLISFNTASTGKYYKKWDNGHYNVVHGIDKHHVNILDPDPWEENRFDFKVPKDIFLVSWIVNSVQSTDFLAVVYK